MAEGRIQFCQQHTPELLWQARWTRHRNKAAGLKAVIACVGDPDEAAQRYARFTGLAAVAHGEERCIDTARGRVLFVTPQAVQRTFRIDPPVLPWIFGTVLTSADMAKTRACIVASGLPHGMLGEERLYVVPPPAVGGVMIFEAKRSAPFTLA
jgi:hypothetical protein